jgi:hypothetical protein
MRKANAALYLAAAAGQMPTSPDFSKPNYAPDRKRLQALIDLAEAGDAAGLRANGIRIFYTGADFGSIPRSLHHRHRGAAGLPGGRLTSPPTHDLKGRPSGRFFARPQKALRLEDNLRTPPLAAKRKVGGRG